MEAPVKVYNCVVRLGGSLLHTVPKERISGEEVRLLKAIHGDDAIANLKEIGHLDGWARDDELNMLADRYSQEPDKRDGRRLVEKVFGTLLTNFDGDLDTYVDHFANEVGDLFDPGLGIALTGVVGQERGLATALRRK